MTQPTGRGPAGSARHRTVGPHRNPLQAYWIAHGAIWLLMLFAAAELRPRRSLRSPPVAHRLRWIRVAGSRHGDLRSYVAQLDVALVLVVFKGDVRLS